jgi:glycyl-tRNA synthetase (class II)
MAPMLGQYASHAVQKYWIKERFTRIGRSPPGKISRLFSGMYGYYVPLSVGVQELEGMAARENFDLTHHQNASGKNLEYFDEQ